MLQLPNLKRGFMDRVNAYEVSHISARITVTYFRTVVPVFRNTYGVFLARYSAVYRVTT